MFSFKLNKSFVNRYITREPNWGFQDVAGNSVGEITFLRTYSRLKPDATKEKWYEVCERVINGMYSLQKDHAKSNRLPWSDSKAHRSAEEAFERMFSFKWTPPGRGLWMMGTPLVMEQRNSAALQNCFTPDTEIVTSDGVRTLADVNGQHVEVWSRGNWCDATVRSFGVQSVQRVTFAPFGSRSNRRVVETVTPDHRWELRDGSTTTALKVGDVVPGSVTDEGFYDESAFIHGMIFADGSVNYRYVNGDFSHSIRLCGDKSEYRNYFDKYHYQPNCNGDPVAYHRSSLNMKGLPPSDIQETQYPDYVRGFIKGWIEFDGSSTGSSDPETLIRSRVLSTQNANAVEWLLRNAATGGYQVVGHSAENRPTNFGERSAPLHKITLTEIPGYWSVKSIEPLDEEVEVMCAVVPDTERFTLASGIHTSNCAFVSTADMTKSNPAEPFLFLMEASMLGVGVGFDLKGASKGFEIQLPKFADYDRQEDLPDHVIPDTREGWVESVGIVLDAYLKQNRPLPVFDYSAIRAAGEPIRTFGGTAAGPEPLRMLHEKLVALFDGRDGDTLTSLDILDIGNLIGVCVVSGNVRRSAELALGSIDDDDFLNAKNRERYPERNSYDPESPGWGWMSNNSVVVKVGDDLSALADGITRNGEPGVIWLDVSREYGRLADAPSGADWRVAGYNPCAEQSLESYEMCTLVETYIGNHDSPEDFARTLKFAYLYAKTVTLLPTHWEQTNSIMTRNRRIGTSVSGLADYADNHSQQQLREMLDHGYSRVRYYDRKYSEWLGVRESIKTTTVKPSGTVSILAGESPGVHWSPGGKYFERRIRFAKDDPMVAQFADAGYTIEPASESPGSTVVVAFPIESKAARSEQQVSIFEKIDLAAQLQHWWSDNSVSVTVSFDPESEGKHVKSVLSMYEGRLKTVSFLPMGGKSYPQMPYTEIDGDQYAAHSGLRKINLDPVYWGNALDAVGEAFCSTDGCEVTTLTNTMDAA